jgi:hypothetical protein
MTRRSARDIERELARLRDEEGTSEVPENTVAFVHEDAETGEWQDSEGNPVEDPDASLVFVLH